jgi:hypothetical protein
MLTTMVIRLNLLSQSAKLDGRDEPVVHRRPEDTPAIQTNGSLPFSFDGCGLGYPALCDDVVARL